MSQIKCRLCGKEKKLVDAHIIPDFMYQYIIASGGIVNTSSKFKKSKKIPNGVPVTHPLLAGLNTFPYSKIMVSVYAEYIVMTGTVEIAIV